MPQQTKQCTVQNYNAAVISFGGLIDSGANGGLSDGRSMRVMEMIEGKTIYVSGVGNHIIYKMPLGIFCTVHHAKPTAFIASTIIMAFFQEHIVEFILEFTSNMVVSL